MAAEWVRLMGARMRERREALGLTQRQVAARLPGEVDGQQVSKWERGKHKPNDATLEHIARILDTTVAALMMDEPAPGTPDLMATLNGDGEDAVALLKQLVERQRALERAVAAVAQVLAERLPPPGESEQRRAS